MSGTNMERVLRLMSEKTASDVYLSANSPILIKINGQLLQLSDQPLTLAQPRQLLADRRLPRTQKSLQLGDRTLADGEMTQDHQPPLVAQGLQKGRRLDNTVRDSCASSFVQCHV